MSPTPAAVRWFTEKWVAAPARAPYYDDPDRSGYAFLLKKKNAEDSNANRSTRGITAVPELYHDLVSRFRYAWAANPVYITERERERGAAG